MIKEGLMKLASADRLLEQGVEEALAQLFDIRFEMARKKHNAPATKRVDFASPMESLFRSLNLRSLSDEDQNFVRSLHVRAVRRSEARHLLEYLRHPLVPKLETSVGTPFMIDRPAN